MESSSIFVIFTILALLFSPPTYAQKASHPSLTPTPAPAPSPNYVNLTKLLTVAGPFHKFLHMLETTKTLETFQNQANNTEEGLTLFVPKDQAFASLKNPSISNLTQDQLKSLCLFHALPHYYSLSEFPQLTQVTTFAGGQYSVNFTDNAGTVRLNTGWTRTKVSSAVFSTDPVAIYQVDKVLLPEAIFGTDIPPMPAPAPAPTPDLAPAADTAAADGKGKGKNSSLSSHSGSYRVASFGVSVQLGLAMVGGIVML